jgi:hypothetical protein
LLALVDEVLNPQISVREQPHIFTEKDYLPF